jgi:hypothetical protein
MNVLHDLATRSARILANDGPARELTNSEIVAHSQRLDPANLP